MYSVQVVFCLYSVCVCVGSGSTQLLDLIDLSVNIDIRVC